MITVANLVAIPLHLARRLSAIRSPSSRCLAFPLTVAICLTGWKVSPSFTCHSTLRKRQRWHWHASGCYYVLAAQLSKDFGEERRTCQHRRVLAFSIQECLTVGLPYNVTCIIERRNVFRQPGGDNGFPARRENVFVGAGHDNHGVRVYSRQAADDS